MAAAIPRTTGARALLSNLDPSTRVAMVLNSQVKAVSGRDQQHGFAAADRLFGQRPRNHRPQRHRFAVLSGNRNQTPPIAQAAGIVMRKLPSQRLDLPRHELNLQHSLGNLRHFSRVRA